MSETPGEHAQREAFVSAAQRAAAVVASRHRGDAAGAATLMGDFPDEETRFLGFYLVADLALKCLSDATGDSLDTTVQQLNLAIEQGMTA